MPSEKNDDTETRGALVVQPRVPPRGSFSLLLPANIVWEERVEGWARSGQTVKEYAAKIGVNPHTLAGWRWKLRQRTAGAAPASR